ncbi:MAG: DUF2849 domain-containing protein [Sphingomonadales bacterium]|jgi:hypothetical protein
MMAKILTANDLKSGQVVFLAEDGSWTPIAKEARVALNDAVTEELAQQGARAEAENIVTLVEIIPAELLEDGPWPSRNREQIRAKGPTVRRDLGYQAEGLI